MRAGFLPHAYVAICVDGQELTEHNTKIDNAAREATTYVEAVPGANYTFQYACEPGFEMLHPRDHIRLSFYVDGERVRAKVQSVLPNSVETLEGAAERRDGVSQTRRFSFAEHAFNDKRPDPSLLGNLAKVGEIKVVLVKCRRLGRSQNLDTVKSLSVVAHDDIPEKAMKGRSISNHTNLGAAEAANIHWVNVDYPYGKDAIATYIFQYRSRRDLEIEGIIARPASPIPLEDRDPDELTAEELRQQVRLLRARQAASVNIKQENQRIKRERPITQNENAGGDDGDEISVVSEGPQRKRARPEDAIDLKED